MTGRTVDLTVPAVQSLEQGLRRSICLSGIAERDGRVADGHAEVRRKSRASAFPKKFALPRSERVKSTAFVMPKRLTWG
jgi:hypothetical protein